MLRRRNALPAPDPSCTHLDAAAKHPDPQPRTPGACEECLRDGTQWLHLRLCLECGHLGCCDSSPMKHASAHYASFGHPVMRSVEPGEDWCWCFTDQLLG